MSETRTFNHTAAALLAFDAGAAKRAQAWDTVETNADVDAAELADAHALRAVQEAFHRDTAEINSLANCYRVDLGFMRRMAASSAPAALVPHQADPDDADDQADAPAPR
ncbi:hypothetical protein ACFPOU_07795 [Massilia jejuensis]|uniref:Uncharacterized protein n=1 Tax=Massilia jejuensis TaxID=648894 RepID=A0ABW0PEE4_9BURK